MKRLFALATILCVSISMMALSTSKIRTHARFISDRMAYELDLNYMQYEDCYEVNYDFIYAVDRIIDDVVWGYEDAIYEYYRLLDYRNEDLSFILSYSQYRKFIATDYFYRPIYTNGRSWGFRIYTAYSNTSFYYYNRPSIYTTYRGGHSRINNIGGFYANRYPGQDRYRDNIAIHNSQSFTAFRRGDFGNNIVQRDANPVYNNYNNKNANNRTQDSRYRDDSGNRNSPQINNVTTGRRNSTSSFSNQNSNSNAGRTSANSSNIQRTNPQANGNNPQTGNNNNQPANTNSSRTATSFRR